MQNAEPAPTPADLPSEPARLTPEPDAAVAEEPEAPDTADEQPTVAPADLPNIDSLDKESDFSVFMQDGVPEQLRNRALRRLWRLDPAFASVDGLLEYDDDFTDAALAVEAVQTVYKIGKGMRGDDDADMAEDGAEDGAEDATDAAASDEDAAKDAEERIGADAEETTPTSSHDGEDTAAAGESEEASKEKNRDA